MPEIIVLDTNTWLFGTRLLRSPLAVALLHVIRERGTVILLPEVVETELYGVLRRTIHRHREDIGRALNEVGSLLGRDVPPPPLPTDGDIDQVIGGRLRDLSSILRRVPLTLAHARSALDRVVKQAPPADKAEEFRDALIWESVAGAGPLATYFVTSDKAFYAERMFAKGLARNLAEQNHRVVVSPDLHAYLDTFGSVSQVQPVFDQLAIVSAVDKATRLELTHRLYGDGQYLELVARTGASVSVFLTDKPDVLACQFSLRYDALYSPDYASRPTASAFSITGEALLPRGESAVLSLDFDTSQLDSGPVVSWRDSVELEASRRFSTIAERRIRLKA